MNIFISSQMRVGSTWLSDMVASLFGVEWTFWAKGKDIQKARFEAEIKKEPRKEVHIFKMHYTPPERICQCIKPGDKNNFVISITRDLRDLAVSKIFYIRYNSPMRTISRLNKLNDMRKEFGKRGIPDRRYVNRFISSPHFNHIVKNWKVYNNNFKHQNYFMVSYEGLNSKRTLFWIRKICDFLGIFRNMKALRTVIVTNNFQTKTGRAPGEGSNAGFRRKGIVGDYKKWINPRNLVIINRIINNVEDIKPKPTIVKEIEQIPKKSINHLIPELLTKKLIFYDKIANEYKLNKEIYNKL